MYKITLSGDVGWEIRAENIRNELAKAKGGDVEMTISSRGGLVGEALEIANLIKNYSGKTTAILAGYAMSAASYIPMFADEVVVEGNAVMMIHNAQGIAWGDHNTMAKNGAILKGLSSLLAGGYAKFSGKDKSEISAMMDAETWLYGDEIVSAGFATRMTGEGEGYKDESTAAARTAFAGIVARMTTDKTAFTADLAKATAMAGDVANRVMVPENRKEENPMDLKTLKEKHPDLVAAITNEATAGMEDKLAAAKTAGAEKERERIKDVRLQMVPGHEALVEALAFDGITSGPEAAVKVIAAENLARKDAAAAFKADAPEPVAQPSTDASSTAKTAPEKLRAEWDKDTKLQSEFAGDFDIYAAYMKEDSGVRVKSINRGAK